MRKWKYFTNTKNITGNQSERFGHLPDFIHYSNKFSSYSLLRSTKRLLKTSSITTLVKKWAWKFQKTVPWRMPSKDLKLPLIASKCQTLKFIAKRRKHYLQLTRICTFSSPCSSHQVSFISLWWMLLKISRKYVSFFREICSNSVVKIESESSLKKEPLFLLHPQPQLNKKLSSATDDQIYHSAVSEHPLNTGI